MIQEVRLIHYTFSLVLMYRRFHWTVDCGDYVVVTNARHVQVTGKKDKQKLYRYHTGWKLKEIPFFTMMEKHPDQVGPHLRCFSIV